MEKLVSSFSNNVKSLPADYIFPPGERPGEEVIPISKTVPVINHGIPDGLVNEMMSVLREFFEMPEEEKAEVNSEDPNRLCRLYTSTLNYDKEDVHYWRDSLRHPCHPLEEYIQSWPQKPSRYREVIAECSVEVTKLALRIMEMISERLGFDAGYFATELSSSINLSVNHYPPCPEPSLSLGLRKHCEPNLITILHQGDVYGLQVLKDGKWFGIEPIPNAFVVNIGYQLQITSNGKLKSVVHRAVTNSSQARTTAVFFIGAPPDAIIEPTKALVNEQNPPFYKSFLFRELLTHYFHTRGDVRATLRPYEL